MAAMQNFFSYFIVRWHLGGVKMGSEKSNVRRWVRKGNNMQKLNRNEIKHCIPFTELIIVNVCHDYK